MDCHADSANLLAMTKYYKFAFDSQSICKANHNPQDLREKRSNHRSNGGVAFVFVENFGIKLGKSLLIPKIFYKCEIAYPRTNCHHNLIS